MNVFLGIIYALAIMITVLVVLVATKTWQKILAIAIAVAIITLVVVFYHSWWMVAWAALIGMGFFAFVKVKAKDHKVLKVILGIVVLALVIGGIFFVLPTTHFGDTNCQPAANLGFTTGGEVINNLDDGDSVMGTILYVTRDNPTKDPVMFVIMPGASVDVEYRGKMYFTSDRFSGSLTEGTCLANSLHNVDDKIVIGADEALPAGWQKAIDGWWSASTWLYQEAAIQPQGLSASKGIFFSADQSKRDIVTKDGEVVYGQFWQPPHDGSVVHIQVRPNQSLTIPQGWEGTYWVWTGDLKVGEKELQKRMLQATFVEVVDRDNLNSVTLLSCGTLPPELDASLYTLYTGDKFGDVTWQPAHDGWTCQPKN